MPTEHRYCNHRHDLDLRVLCGIKVPMPPALAVLCLSPCDAYEWR